MKGLWPASQTEVWGAGSEYWSLLSCVEPYLVTHWGDAEGCQPSLSQSYLSKQALKPFQPASDRSNTHGTGAACDDDGVCGTLFDHNDW